MSRHSHHWKRRATGVYQCKTCGGFRVRTTWKDPRTGKMKEVQECLPEGTTLGGAVDRIDELKAELAADYEPTPQKLPTLRDYSTSWLGVKATEVKGSTARLYAKILAQQVLPTLGDLYVDAIRRIDVQSLVNLWGKQYAVNTCSSWAAALLFPLLQDAAADHDLPDPTRRVRVWGKKSPRPRQWALSPEELVALLEGITDPQRRLEVETLVWTGMRVGELFALQWEDVDLAEAVLVVHRRVLEGELDSPKGGKKRTVPLPKRLSESLAAWRREMIVEQHPGLASGLVFPSLQLNRRDGVGHFRSPGGLGKALRAAAKAAGLGRVTPHTCRHTYTTRLREVAPDHLVQAIVGHAHIQQTDHYTHPSNDALRGAVGGLEKE